VFPQDDPSRLVDRCKSLGSLDGSAYSPRVTTTVRKLNLGHPELPLEATPTRKLSLSLTFDKQKWDVSSRQMTWLSSLVSVGAV
jgi:hypothetical protein